MVARKLVFGWLVGMVGCGWDGWLVGCDLVSSHYHARVVARKRLVLSARLRRALRTSFCSLAKAHKFSFLEPEEIRGSFSYKIFFFHLGLSEKHIIFKIGDTFFFTWPDPSVLAVLVPKGPILAVFRYGVRTRRDTGVLLLQNFLLSPRAI